MCCAFMQRRTATARWAERRRRWRQQQQHHDMGRSRTFYNDNCANTITLSHQNAILVLCMRRLVPS